MIEQLTRGDFEDLPTGALSVEHTDSVLAMEVLEVRDLPTGSPRAKPFAVVLAGPATPVLPQRIHALNHPRHGRLELFMVPIGRDAQRVRYELIFN
jgi:hypothetical protein